MDISIVELALDYLVCGWTSAAMKVPIEHAVSVAP
jgi:hypothetical protein